MKTEFILAAAAGMFQLNEEIGDQIITVDTPSSLTPVDFRGLFLANREMLETNTSFRQLIPYIVFVQAGDILAFARTNKGGEERLHDRVTVGLGGHIDAIDVSFDSKSRINLAATLARATDRELEEEITYDGKPVSLGAEHRHRFTHFILGAEGVNAVHVGLLQVVFLNESMDLLKFGTTDEGLSFIGALSLDQLSDPELFERLEPWSKAVVSTLTGLRANAEQTAVAGEVEEGELVE